MNKNITNTKGKIDWMITLVPLGIVIALCILFFLLRSVKCSSEPDPIFLRRYFWNILSGDRTWNLPVVSVYRRIEIRRYRTW